MSEKDPLYAMRHSLAHVMASAIDRLFSDVKFGIGPVVKDGFYYDIDTKDTISTEDFAKIEAEMKKIIGEKQDFEKSDKAIDEAISWAKEAGQPYKEELLNDLKRSGTTVAKDLNADELGTIAEGDGAIESVSFYTNGDFTDLCRGPHVANTGEVGAFKLLRVAGAYWRANEKNSQMQRVYGVAFSTQEELDQYLANQEEARQRDHRKLGKELDLFITSELVGSGLPLFTPRGTVLREELSNYANELRENIGYEKVWIPHITKAALYEKSGHQAKFGDELFLVKSQETSDEFVLKPMNCPHHTRIYAAKPRSYRNLPVRYLETTTVYRDEKTGELGGLSRVRSITQDDSHVFCRQDQIENEISNLLSAAVDMYKAVDMNLRVRLSYRDESDAYLGDDKLWQSAQEQLKNAVVASKLDYFEETGEAAFYGPKIDFMATDALDREHQLATVQLDFVQPSRFDLEYVAEDGSKQTPVMIHCALLGSIERFLSVYIEHTGGKFPVWLAPEQIRIVQVKDSPELSEFVDKILAIAKENGVRATVDRTDESVGKKIRAGEVMKLPYIVVVGEKELQSGVLTPRVRQDFAVHGRLEAAYPYENLITSIAHETTSRVQKSSL